MRIAIEDNVQFYENLWLREWADMEKFNPTARHLKRIIVRLIKQVMPVQTILDVGCGMGLNVRHLHQNFPSIRITGADLSQAILDVAHQYVGANSAIDFIPLDLEKAALDQKFDLVLCNQVLEHIEDDVQALHHLAQMTGKYILITVPGGAYNSTSKLVGHYRHYSRSEICSKVTAAGFRIVSQREWGFPIHNIYKFLLDALPSQTQKAIGMGRYGLMKKLLSGLIYIAFYANQFDKGANVIVLAEKAP